MFNYVQNIPQFKVIRSHVGYLYLENRKT